MVGRGHLHLRPGGQGVVFYVPVRGGDGMDLKASQGNREVPCGVTKRLDCQPAVYHPHMGRFNSWHSRHTDADWRAFYRHITFCPVDSVTV